MLFGLGRARSNPNTSLTAELKFEDTAQSWSAELSFEISRVVNLFLEIPQLWTRLELIIELLS